MNEAIISLFAIGWIDFFTPVPIIMVMALRPVVEKKWHVIYYIIGSYVAYIIAAYAIFFGAQIFLKQIWDYLCNIYPTVVFICRFVIGITAIVLAIVVMIKLITKLKRHESLSIENVFEIKSVKPIFLFLLGFATTFSNVYSAYPLFSYITVLVSLNLPLSSDLILLAAFCTFYLLPMLIVFILSIAIKGERFQKIMDRFCYVITVLCYFCIPVLLGIVGCWALSCFLV